MKSRLTLIGMIALLMLGAVYIVGTTMRSERSSPGSVESTVDFDASIPLERGVFERSGDAMFFQDMPESQRSLEAYYRNRAYPGAPPIVPHPILIEKGIGGKNCLQCHQNGGYVERFKAFAPLTPHPTWLNCKQCHVPRETNSEFKSSLWAKMTPPKRGQAWLEGSPPVIPHEIKMRNNCLSCHAGAGAPKEIRVSHPERINCKQCHVPKSTNGTFEKPDKPMEFSRPGPGGASTGLSSEEAEQISSYLKNEFD